MPCALSRGYIAAPLPTFLPASTPFRNRRWAVLRWFPRFRHQPILELHWDTCYGFPRVVGIRQDFRENPQRAAQADSLQHAVGFQRRRSWILLFVLNYAAGWDTLNFL